jgi:hypothetical protein
MKINEYNFMNANIEDINELDDDFDIVMFPKSINEFSSSQFKYMKQLLSNICQNDKIIIAASIRADDYNSGLDISRCDKMIEVFEDKYNYLDDKSESWCTKGNKALATLFPGFSYPDEIIHYIGELNTKCDTYIIEGENCEKECLNMNRYPILTAGNVRYYINRLLIK